MAHECVGVLVFVSLFQPLYGMIGADHSHRVGTPQVSLISELSSTSGVDFLSNATCFVYNKTHQSWESRVPCSPAAGICKSKLGNYRNVNVLVFSSVQYKVVSFKTPLKSTYHFPL